MVFHILRKNKYAMSKCKCIVVKKDDRYKSLYVINGYEYEYNQIYIKRDITKEHITHSLIDRDSGLLLYDKTQTLHNYYKQRYYTYCNTYDVAMDKNVKREKHQSLGKDIIELYKKDTEYLQVSCGSNHEKRGIITIDLDIKHSNTTNEVNKILKDKFNLLDKFSIEKPSVYQIHNTNGHVQLHWFLDKEINVVKYKLIYDKNHKCKNIDRRECKNMKYFKECFNFLNILFEGDSNFTCWQIKNMYITNELYINDFNTFWLLDNSTYSDEIVPINPKRYLFETLHKNVLKHLDKDGELYEKLLKELNFTQRENIENLTINNTKTKKTPIDSVKVTVIKGNIGRNEFVRKSVYETIREYKNNISIDDCRNIVKDKLNKALCNFSYLSGTKNLTPYSDNDFERDFFGTYQHAISTYRTSYDNKQRELALKTIKNKKINYICMIYNILLENPNLVKNTTKNSLAIISILKEKYGIEIKSKNTIRSYKETIGIIKNQNSLNSKNNKNVEKLKLQI